MRGGCRDRGGSARCWARGWFAGRRREGAGGAAWSFSSSSSSVCERLTWPGPETNREMGAGWRAGRGGIYALSLASLKDSPDTLADIASTGVKGPILPQGNHTGEPHRSDSVQTAPNGGNSRLLYPVLRWRSRWKGSGVRAGGPASSRPLPRARRATSSKSTSAPLSSSLGFASAATSVRLGRLFLEGTVPTRKS